MTATPSRPPSIADIARRAKVSVSTVSRVLSGEIKGTHPRIAARNDRIRRIADELNYRPSFHARSFQRGSTRTIGLLYGRRQPMIGGSYGGMLEAAIEVFETHGYHVMLQSLRDRDADRTDLFLDQRFDGCLIHHELRNGVWEAFRRASLPAVLLNAPSDHDIPQILPDEPAGTRALMKHLLGLGHRRIAFAPCAITDAPGFDRLYFNEEHFSVGARTDAYRRAMRRAGLGDHVQIVHGFEGPAVAQSLMQLTDRPTALVVGRAAVAAHVAAIVQREGVRIPDQLSVATFMTDVDRALSAPALTHVQIPMREMGRLGADRLLEAIDRRAQSEAEVASDRVLLKTELVFDESTAPPC